MKLRILSTAILLAVGVANPVLADVQQSQTQRTIVISGNRDYDWQWDHDRRRDDADQRVEIRNRYDRNWERTDRRGDRYLDYYDDIDQIYQEVLGRNIDNSGLRRYGKRLESGDSLREIRTQIADSQEARDAIASIYEDITGRNASRSMVKTYSRKLASGWTLDEVQDDITQTE